MYYAIILKSIADKNMTNSVNSFFNLCVILKEDPAPCPPQFLLVAQ